MIKLTPFLLLFPLKYLSLHSFKHFSVNKVLYLPELLKWYSKDFGGTTKNILTNVRQLLGKDTQLFEDITRHIDQNKPNIAYIPFNWNFEFVI